MNYRLSMCFTLACLLAYASYGAELHGLVLDNDSAPQAGWPIILTRTEPGMRGKLMVTNTSPSGHFYYKDLAIGEYYLVLGSGYLSQAIIIAKSSWSSNIVARPATTSHTLSVRILQIPDNSKPLKVKLFPSKATVISEFNRTGIRCPADSTVYVFTNLFAGSYGLHIESSANIRNICDVTLSDVPKKLRFDEAYERLVPFAVKLWQGEHEQEGIIWSAVHRPPPSEYEQKDMIGSAEHKPLSGNLKKIICPRCQGDEIKQPKCTLCGGQGTIWVDTFQE